VNVDIVVVGAGPGGLAAAVTAARGGLRVAVVDPLDRVGGNAAVSTGYLAILGSDEQDAAGVRDTPELYLHDLLREVEQYRSDNDIFFDEELADFVARRTSATYRLLRELGFTFDGFVNRPAQYSVPRLLKVSDPSLFDRAFRRECERLGVQLALRSSVEAVESAGGRMRDVVVRRPDGDAEVITAEIGVVLATGGYQADGELRRRARANMPDEAPFLGVPTCRGDGHRLGETAGAAMVNMSFLPRIVMIGSALAEDAIAVGPDGRRFHDETGPSEDRVRAVERRAGEVHYVFDDAARRRYPDLVAQFPDPVISADSVVGLADRIGVNATALAGTVDQWNTTVGTGAFPDEFGRVIAPPAGGGLETAPFHAARCRLGSAFTVGGVRVDRSARVLTPAGVPIPGLFAVGDCTGVLNAAAGTGGVHITSALALGQASMEDLLRQ
jgi:succinate dehydrogenase/fumarate reductase flavoprotein subunit